MALILARPYATMVNSDFLIIDVKEFDGNKHERQKFYEINIQSDSPKKSC